MILLGLTTILIRTLLDDRHALISIATDGLVEQTNNDHRFLILEKKKTALDKKCHILVLGIERFKKPTRKSALSDRQQKFICI